MNTYIGLKDRPKQLEIFGLFFGVGAGQKRKSNRFFFSFVILMFSSWQLYIYSTKKQLHGEIFIREREVSNARIFNVFIGFAIPYVC